jgi:hypothetical protein
VFTQRQLTVTAQRGEEVKNLHRKLGFLSQGLGIRLIHLLQMLKKHSVCVQQKSGTLLKQVINLGTILKLFLGYFTFSCKNES